MGIKFRTPESCAMARTLGEFSLKQIKSLQSGVIAARDQAFNFHEAKIDAATADTRGISDYSRDYYAWSELAWGLKRLINTMEATDEELAK